MLNRHMAEAFPDRVEVRFDGRGHRLRPRARPPLFEKTRDVGLDYGDVVGDEGGRHQRTSVVGALVFGAREVEEILDLLRRQMAVGGARLVEEPQRDVEGDWNGGSGEKLGHGTRDRGDCRDRARLRLSGG